MSALRLLCNKVLFVLSVFPRIEGLNRQSAATTMKIDTVRYGSMRLAGLLSVNQNLAQRPSRSGLNDYSTQPQKRSRAFPEPGSIRPMRFAFNDDATARAFFSETITAMPMPMLNT